MKGELTLNDLLNVFDDYLMPEDVLYAKLSSQISTAIIKERLRLKMSQKNFANYIHAAQSSVSRWESENYNFTLKKIAKIAAALDMDIDIKLHRQYNENKIYEHAKSCNTVNTNSSAERDYNNNYNYTPFKTRTNKLYESKYTSKLGTVKFTTLNSSTYNTTLKSNTYDFTIVKPNKERMSLNV